MAAMAREYDIAFVDLISVKARTGVMEVAGLPVELWRPGQDPLAPAVLGLPRVPPSQLAQPATPGSPSWREALRQQALASRTWTRNGPESDSAACLYLFRRKKDRRTWCVGAGFEHETLRGALSVAGPYDRVVLHPGVYEEQTEVVLKVPVEIIGKGKLGEVALLVSIDQQCPTARLCNLVFMPAWFSPVVYKTSSGHVQLDNCNLEGGQLQVRGPGTCQARYCSFGQNSGAHFQSVALSLLESCDFSGSDAASITVEGPPVSDRNWACKHLAALAKSSTAAIVAASSGAGPTASMSSAAQPEGVDGRPRVQPPGVKTTVEDLWRKGGTWGAWRCGGRAAEEDYGEGTVIGDGCSESEPSDEEEEEEEEEGENEEERQEASRTAAYKLSYSRHGLSHLLEQSPDDSSPGPNTTPPELRTLQQELQRDREAQALASSVQGCLLYRCLFRDGKGGVLVCNNGQAWLEGNVFRSLTYAVRCIQNAKIVMLRNEVCGCRASGVFLRLSAQGLIAENNIHSNAEAGLDIRKGANPIILCNRIHSGLRSGIVVLGNGKGSIRSNQICGNKEAGIYILYNGNPVVSGNYIFQGQAAGIAVNENGRGLIVENVIRENQWGGVDIRRGGDPVLRNNFICHGYSDGVVVGERGRGLIEGNHIYCNRGCGVWVMSSSLPQLSGNRITHNRIYGVAVFCRKDSQGGELLAWESDLDSEDERFSSRRPVSVALVEGNRISHNGAVGLYVKSSEPLNVVGNAVYSNSGVGVALLQSAQLSRVIANCICGNGRAGVAVAAGSRVELRGNGVYDNGGPGISSRGDGQIVENDVMGNQGCGLRLRESADIRVLRNRVQSARGCGIVVLEQVKGVVQENLVFQGWASSTKPLLHRDPGNNTCLLHNNTLLARCRRSNGQTDPAWALENPPPRPQLEGQPTSAPSGPPTQRGIAIATRITARVESGCHNNGSIFCTIL
ncbi:hypothetical protein AAFF_G00192020 [Aldrovandia affinis]|uniref:Carbohydrate-binding/sugar hydrolysis domain-containing protein n=1 Tax=Aldrovandia affinis TaxID=143900 RepID=A0AAD7W5M2_9TELE|nr:hypothetical protein AAFF_G00192020 [Aldrovandia affinis]